MLQDYLSSLKQLQEEALAQIEAAASLKEMEELRVRYLGKKSDLNSVMRQMKDLTPLERPILGERANETKEALTSAISRRAEELDSTESSRRMQQEVVDVTLPGEPVLRGRVHPITQVIEEVEGIFVSMGFKIEEGPEIEDDFHNFEALNIPPHHPARDMHDTFYLPEDRLLRTHTSPVQIRAMRRRQPPMALITVGKTYRVDSDPTHSPMFHQLEGFVIDSKITFGDLKGTLHNFIRAMFGAEAKVRFRPSYFPFTEPSAEVDMSWTVTREVEGRRVESEEWLEILGAGMIHPRVMEYGGVDPGKFTGFAFGVGIERLAMLKFGIKDIRQFYENDVRFLGQF
ncbi:MAG: phenylalanine--tRNA ligase subunit alpha [Candidatus Sumerlaeota bacterium]|nr:phenylalanine--tRNA ligase subunit alpha [Candidatus Sumerlaeota bacterium]